MPQNENENDIKSTQITFKTRACHGYQSQKLSFINGVTQNHHYKNKQTTTLWSQGGLHEPKKMRVVTIETLGLH